jgi:hypothetical protein
VSSFDGLFLFFSMVGGEMVMFVVLSVKVCVGRTVVDARSAACRLWIPARGRSRGRQTITCPRLHQRQHTYKNETATAAHLDQINVNRIST